MIEYDVAIVGGGLLGSAFGWGLARSGQRCVIFDEGDNAIRTARANFGLVWVQGKGKGMPAYARWSLKACQLWSGFAAELEDSSGIALHYFKGGYDIATDEAELERSVSRLHQIRDEMGDDAYDFEVLDHKGLKQAMPMIGDIPGATYTEHDGHCNPLLLLRALHGDMQTKGATYRPNCPVSTVNPVSGGGFDLIGRSGETLARAAKVVISAGHGSPALARPLAIDLPIHADQGQILVTEKAAPVMHHATNVVRQTDNGSLLLGASRKAIGLDTRTDVKTLAAIAKRCIKIFPVLGQLRLQRAWGGLRVMTPDEFPVYQQSESHPGVFSFACHSGVTLAACHALEVSRWVIDGAIPDIFDPFHPRRFHV